MSAASRKRERERAEKIESGGHREHTIAVRQKFNCHPKAPEPFRLDLNDIDPGLAAMSALILAKTKRPK